MKKNIHIKKNLINRKLKMININREYKKIKKQ